MISRKEAEEKLREVVKELGVDYDDLIRAWELMGEDERNAMLKPERAAIARSGVTAEAFANFHWVITGLEASPYVRDTWIPELIEAYENRTGVLFDAFRGSGKSFILALWVLFLTGHNPVGSSTLVRINELAAKETGKFVSSVIEYSPGWEMCFPNVVPDKDAGWSSEGYNVKDSSVPYGQWVEMAGADHLGEPSLLCAGVTSRSIIGKHPTNGMYFDDLHNEANTRSEREMQSIVDIFTSDIIPTWNRPSGHPTLAVACTLWHEKDVYHAMMATGKFKHIQQPIMWPDPDGEYIAETKAHNGERVSLAWPEAFPMWKIVDIEDTNPVQFWRMYLCNLEMMKGLALKREWLHYYPSDKVDTTWPVFMGVDFASTMDKLKDKDRDYFTVAIGRAIPSGGIVLTGGYRAKLSRGEAVAKLVSIASMFPTLQLVGVEKWGKGEEFVADLLYQTNLPIMPLPMAGATVKSKGQRFQEGLAPMMMMGRMWVGDVKDDFIRAFEDEWVGWDGGKSRTGHDDTLDAVYWLANVSRGELMRVDQELEKIGQSRNNDSPYKDVGGWKGYGRKH